MQVVVVVVAASVAGCASIKHYFKSIKVHNIRVLLLGKVRASRVVSRDVGNAMRRPNSRLFPSHFHFFISFSTSFPSFSFCWPAAAVMRRACLSPLTRPSLRHRSGAAQICEMERIYSTNCVPFNWFELSFIASGGLTRRLLTKPAVELATLRLRDFFHHFKRVERFSEYKSNELVFLVASQDSRRVLSHPFLPPFSFSFFLLFLLSSLFFLFLNSIIYLFYSRSFAILGPAARFG